MVQFSYHPNQTQTRYPADEGVLGKRLFLVAFVLGLALRLVAIFLGDIDPGGDGMWRLGFAVGWAEHPQWAGLSGVWPPLHWYFLGTLIWLWNEPILLAKLTSLFFGMGAIFMMRQAVRHLFGDLVAALAALLLAIYWTHIWLTSSYWVELPFILLVVTAVHYATRSMESRRAQDALVAGVCLTLAILLRHEGQILLGLFLLWYLVNVRDKRLLVTFAALPLCAAAWMLIEPGLNGGSYLALAAWVKQQKAGENLMQGVTLRECLTQWILMPAAIPSLFVVIPGLYGLWHARRLLRRDLFGWMFIAQVSFYMTMTLTSAWRPQLRYVLLYFVNLLPYAAYIWVQLLRRFAAPPQYALAALLIMTVIAQSAAWWVGRNNRYPLGWLPLRVLSSPQQSLDQWVRQIAWQARPGTRLLSLVAGSRTAPWSLGHAFLVNRIPSNLFSKNSAGPIKSEELYVADYPGLHRGEVPSAVYAADIVLLDPAASYYPSVLEALRTKNAQVTNVHPHITALVSPSEAAPDAAK